MLTGHAQHVNLQKDLKCKYFMLLVVLLALLKLH